MYPVNIVFFIMSYMSYFYLNNFVVFQDFILSEFNNSLMVSKYKVAVHFMLLCKYLKITLFLVHAGFNI